VTDTYTCVMCRETFEKSISDEEAMAEYRHDFPDLPKDEPKEIVCDDCYRVVTSTPAQIDLWRATVLTEGTRVMVKDDAREMLRRGRTGERADVNELACYRVRFDDGETRTVYVNALYPVYSEA